LDAYILKTVGLRIRVEPELRESFIAACKEEDLSAAHVLRSFMKDYITGYELAKQQDLFPVTESPSKI